jgi:hypothetical protein
MRDYLDEFVLLWKDYARECAGDTNLLPDKTIVIFNKWFSDESYRRTVSNSLGIKYIEDSRERMTPEGNGSSFDGMSKNGAASTMTVNHRYQHYMNDASFWKRLVDPELIDLYLRIFPENNDLREKARSLL